MERWIEAGWVTPGNAQAILSSTGAEATTHRIPQILALLGGVLISFAAISLVASNWSELSKITKLTLLFVSMWGAWGAAVVLERRRNGAFAEAAIVAGLGLFGANIALIAQIYHVDTGSPGWIFLWSCVSIAAAWALPSRAALAIGILLAIVWSALARHDLFHTQWMFILPWALCLFLTLRLSWLAGFHLIALSGWVWAALNADTFTSAIGGGRSDLAAIYILVALALWLSGSRISVRSLRFGAVLESYGIIVTFTLLCVLQAAPAESSVGAIWIALAILGLCVVAALAFHEMRSARFSARDIVAVAFIATGAVLYPAVTIDASLVPWVYGALFLAGAVWLIAYGTSQRNRFAVNAGFTAFGLEVLYLYFQTLGTLLNTAVFFALGGGVLIGGSLLMARIRRRVVASAGEGMPK